MAAKAELLAKAEQTKESNQAISVSVVGLEKAEEEKSEEPKDPHLNAEDEAELRQRRKLSAYSVASQHLTWKP